MSQVAFELPRVVVIIIASAHFHDQLLDLHVDKLVFLGNLERILLFLGAGRTHQDDALGSAWSISILQLENAVDLFNNAHLFTLAFKLCYETLTDVLHSLDL